MAYKNNNSWRNNKIEIHRRAEYVNTKYIEYTIFVVKWICGQP